MSLVPRGDGGLPVVVERVIEWGLALFYDLKIWLTFHTDYIYFWLRDFAPIIIKALIIQLGCRGIDNLTFLNWETRQEVKRWFRNFAGT